MGNLNELCGFDHDPNLGVDLPWVNLAYTRTTVTIPKFWGAASKHYRYM
jgi:hypothetical protein